jgi:hypothetical protein
VPCAASKHGRVWGRSGPRVASFLGVFSGAVLVAVLGPFLGACGRRCFGALLWRRGGGRGARALCRFVFSSRVGAVRWGGAVRGVRALRGCASRPVCVRARGVSGAAFAFFIVGFFGARCAGVPLLRAPRALRFFFFGRVACPPGGFLFRFFILFFCLFCFVFTSAPCRCVSVSVAASPLVLRAASLFSFSAALKNSLKFFLPVFKQGP